MRISKRHILIILIAAAAAAVIVITGRLGRGGGQSTALQQEEAVPVSVARAAPHAFHDTIEGVATLTARNVCPLSPKVNGHVKEILADVGDRVSAGQVVVRLDPTDYELAVHRAEAALETAKASLADLLAWTRKEDVAAAEAAYEQARARFENAEKDYKRAQQLLAKHVIAQSQFDAIESNYKATREAMHAVQENLRKARSGPTKEDVAVAEARVKQAEAALAEARQQLAYTEIRTPISGIVVERNVDVGQAVNSGVFIAGQYIMRIVDNSIVRAELNIPEKDFARIRPGTPAVVSVDAFPGRQFHGRVIALAPAVSRKARTFHVRVEVENPEGKLVDGMFARVRLDLGERTALAIPRDALLRIPGSGTYYVFTVDADNVAHKKTIAVGLIKDEFAEVTGGLSKGDLVVTSGAGRVRSGAHVKPLQAGTESQ